MCLGKSTPYLCGLLYDFRHAFILTFFLFRYLLYLRRLKCFHYNLTLLCNINKQVCLSINVGIVSSYPRLMKSLYIYYHCYCLTYYTLERQNTSADDA